MYSFVKLFSFRIAHGSFYLYSHLKFILVLRINFIVFFMGNTEYTSVINHCAYGNCKIKEDDTCIVKTWRIVK